MTRLLKSLSLSIVFIFVAISTNVLAQATDLDLIRQNFDRQVECWNNGDIECYVEAYVRSDSTRVISKEGVIFGYDQILNLYKKYWNKDYMGMLTFNDINMERFSDEYYFVTGQYDVALPDGNHHRGYFSVTMKKVDDAWRIYSDHS